jgi:hypothetical protein
MIVPEDTSHSKKVDVSKLKVMILLPSYAKDIGVGENAWILWSLKTIAGLIERVGGGVAGRVGDS